MEDGRRANREPRTANREPRTANRARDARADERFRSAVRVDDRNGAAGQQGVIDHVDKAGDLCLGVEEDVDKAGGGGLLVLGARDPQRLPNDTNLDGAKLTVAAAR